MGRISDIARYNVKNPVALSDILIGSNRDAFGKTQNFEVGGIVNAVLDYIGDTEPEGNGLVSVDSIVESGGIITVTNAVWRIQGDEYSNALETLPIAAAIDGFYRTDIITGNASNQLLKITGTEDEDNPIQPLPDPGTVLIAVINVFGDTFQVEVPPTQNAMLKSEEAQFLFYNTGNITSLVWNNKNTYRWRGVTGTTVEGMSSASPGLLYDGRSLTIINDGTGVVTLKSGGGIIPFELNGLATLGLQIGENIVFKYSSRSNSLEFVSISRIANGVPTLQTVLEAGSTGILRDAGNTVQLAAAVVGLSDLYGGVVGVTKAYAELNRYTPTGTNGFRAHEAGTSMSVLGSQRLQFTQDNSIVSWVPLQYANEEDVVRPKMTNPAMIPSIGKVAEMIGAVGTPTLQQVLEEGSIAVLTAAGTGIPITLASLVTATTKGASLYVDGEGATLSSSDGAGTSVIMGASGGSARIEVNEENVFTVSATSSVFNVFPAEYNNENSLRLLMNDPKFIPSMGKVQEMINDSIAGDLTIIRNKPYYYPSWYTGIRIPISIADGRARYTYDVADNIVLSNYTPYFISPAGNDANDGLSQLTPKKSIPGALTAGAKLIYMMPGIYLRDTMYTSATNLAGNDLIIIGIGEVNITSGQGGLSWVLSTNNTYRATRSNVSNVIDFKFKNKYGFYTGLKKVSTQALCEAESGTFFTDNVGVWVHAQDNRVPDANLLPTLVASNVLTTNAGKVYHENLNFYDIELYITGDVNTSTLEIYMKNVNVPLTKIGTGLLEFNNYRLGNFKTAILQDCVSMESKQDIYNYHNVVGVPNSCVVELDCSAYAAGLNIVGTNNQCSSVHEAIKILRLNGNYYGGNAQVIADVGVGTQTVMVGCELNTGTEQANSVIFFGVNADLEACKLIGNKIIAAENTSVEGVNIRNSILEYSTTVGDVNIS